MGKCHNGRKLAIQSSVLGLMVAWGFVITDQYFHKTVSDQG
ncbi:MAG: hypothetical protein WA963_10620 [Bermanella sp.]